MKRKSIPPRALAAENAAITQFLFDCTTPEDAAKIPLVFLFNAYRGWRKLNKLPETRLTIDGFGRLFPKAFPRKSAYWAPAKHALKCVFGLNLK